MWSRYHVALVLLFFLAAPARAHFGMVIPSSATVTDKSRSGLTLDIAFAHPMEQKGMDMARPKAFTVTVDGRTEHMENRLKPSTIMGHKAWTAGYKPPKPGVYQFAVEPEPYFEPTEDCYIIHYTKTIMSAFGEEEGWDAPLGLKTEIIPLTRPFGNYTGNVFQGRVLLDGKPSPGVEVEVEFYNRENNRTAPDDYFVTQVVKTDADGVFTYAAPWAGWWGFAALNTAGEKMDHMGVPKNVELGAVLWVHFTAPKER